MSAPPVRARLGRLTLKTRLLLMMLSRLARSVSSLAILHLRSEARLFSQLRDYTEDLSTHIEVSQEPPRRDARQPQDALKAYTDKLRQLGVKDVSIADSSEVQASTNPLNVGKQLLRSNKRKGPKQYVIHGVLGEETGPPGSRRTTTLTLPIVLGDKRVGYLLITRYLDDFSALRPDAFLTRLLQERLHFAERSTALGRLASAVAHEIRNPLNFINLSIDHVRERLAPAEPARRQDFDRILANVKAEVLRLNRLVGDFLSFGKP